jgi:hypothetical protein
LAVNGILKGGEVEDGASVIDKLYEKLDLDNIHLDGDNAIMDVQLVSRINSEDRRHIINSIEYGRSNQRTEVLLNRIGRLSVAQRDSLQSIISRKDTSRISILDSIRYEIIANDDLSEWITFHNSSTIDVNLNLDNGSGSDITQAEFTRLMAHELLHHWWTHFKPFEKLKWKVIRDKKVTRGYQLADGLSSESPVDSNRGYQNQDCSSGPGHERYNPEHAKVCGDQKSYQLNKK